MLNDLGDPLSKPSVAAELGRRLRLVARRMNAVVDRQNFPSSFLQPLRLLLHQPGKLLQSVAATGKPITSEDHSLWSLTVIVAHAAAANAGMPGTPMRAWRAATPIAAAAEFLGLALDLIDDIQDNDSALVKRVGVPITLNVAIALLELTNAAIDDYYTPVPLRAYLHELFTSAILTALGGQFLDLAFEQREQRVLVSEVLDMTARKSGTLLGVLCQAGALVGAHSRVDLAQATAISEDFGEFGRAVGIIEQLANDERDARLATGNNKSDRARAKKTLPLVFEAEYLSKGEHSLDESAAATLRFVRYMTDMYRIQALDALDKLAMSYDIRVDILSWLITNQEALL